ncbi:MAG TPA: hypothetical protein VFY30_11975 [Solirubrobacterales bacterium]|nr:hypothetical protein [Solirubrobacterales bacterium]
MGALDQLRAANGQDGIVERARSNPRWAIAIATAAVLFLAWIAWAIYVTRSNGATAGLGVVLAWPAMLVALALISLPFIGGYLLIRRLSDGDGSAVAAEAPVEDEDDDSEEEADDEDSEEEDEDSGADEGEDSDNVEDEDSEESDDDEETEEAAEKASD